MEKEKKSSVMQNHIANCTSSGLSVKQYCKNNGLHPSVYYYWLKQLSINSTGNFIKISSSISSESSFSILFNNGHKFCFDILPPIDYLKKLLA